MQIAPQRKDISAFAIGRPGLDICEPRSVERALGDIRPDVLINLAGYTDVDGAESEPELAFALNSAGARLLAEAAARRDVPIIHDFATGERLNSGAPQKQSLFCRVVDLCGKREGAAIDFFGAQEANIL